MGQRKGGIIKFKVGGVLYDAKGAFTYNIGRPKREAVVGADTVHGYTEAPQVAFIEGAITDRADMDLSALLMKVDETISLELANGKVIVLREAWYANEGTGNTEQGEIPVRFEGKSAEEVPA